jgi:hypothetical protein
MMVGVASSSKRFHRRHEQLYTYSQRDQEAVLVNLRVAVVGVLPGLPQEPALTSSAPSSPAGERRIYLDEFLIAPVFLRLSHDGGRCLFQPLRDLLTDVKNAMLVSDDRHADPRH